MSDRASRPCAAHPDTDGGSAASEVSEVPDVRETPSWWVALVLLPVRLYQRYVSGLLGQNCKYFPTCSSYAVQALTRHGLFKGSALAIWRLLRCNPWSHGGSDRVPAQGRWTPDPYVPPKFAPDGSFVGGTPPPRT